MVNEKGVSKREQVSGFAELWPTFQRINCRYDDAKQRYQAYNIEQVLGILQKEGHGVTYDKDIYLYFLERSNEGLKKELTKAKSFAFHLYNRLHQTLMSAKTEELQRLLSEVEVLEVQGKRRLAEIQEQRIRLRKQLRAGELTNVEYQRQWSPLNHEKKYLRNDAQRYAEATLHTLFPNDNITLYEVRKFIANNHEQDNSKTDDKL